jgi:hypothetical protein
MVKLGVGRTRRVALIKDVDGDLITFEKATERRVVVSLDGLRIVLEPIVV